MKKIQRFLWWCSGVNAQILEQYPIEWGKYFGIGGTIIFTALMASFAGGYAFLTAFKDPWLASAFGLFWGALIFNLDRYIVSSIGKGDGTSKITRDEFMNSLPRLVLAVLIGFVIATPLELKVFEREIDNEIQVIINEKRQKMIGGLNDMRKNIQDLKDDIAEKRNQEDTFGKVIEKGDDPRIKISNQEISNLSIQEGRITKELSSVQANLNKIASDVVILNSQPGSGEKVRALYQRRLTLDGKKNLLGKQLQQIQSKISKERIEISKIQSGLGKDYGVLKEQNGNAVETLNRQIKELDSLYQQKVKEYSNISIKYNGFMAQLEGLDRLCVQSDTIFGYALPSTTVSDTSSLNSSLEMRPTPYIKHINQHKTVVFYAKWMLTLLLIAIEITPILFKMMAESGPYDDRVEEIRYESEVKKKKFISDVNQQINTELQLGQSLTEQKLKSELEANQALLSAIANAQSDIIMEAIEQWKKKQMERAQSNPEEFVSTNNSVPRSVFEVE